MNRGYIRKGGVGRVAVIGETSSAQDAYDRYRNDVVVLSEGARCFRIILLGHI